MCTAVTELNMHVVMSVHGRCAVTCAQGFTEMSRQVEAVEVMTFLNALYSRYDELLDVFDVYK